MDTLRCFSDFFLQIFFRFFRFFFRFFQMVLLWNNISLRGIWGGDGYPEMFFIQSMTWSNDSQMRRKRKWWWWRSLLLQMMTINTYKWSPLCLRPIEKTRKGPGHLGQTQFLLGSNFCFEKSYWFCQDGQGRKSNAILQIRFVFIPTVSIQ